MNLMDRKVQEEFFQDYLHARTGGAVQPVAASIDDDWSALRFDTPRGLMVVRVDETAPPDVQPYSRTAVAASLAASGGEAPQVFLRDTPGVFDVVRECFDAPLACPGGAEIYGWDCTRKNWPKPFYVRRYIEGPNLSVMPRAGYFRQAGAALRKAHAVRFDKPYGTFRAAAQGRAAKKGGDFSLTAAIEAAEGLLPPVLQKALSRAEAAEGDGAACLLSNTFFGGNIIIDDRQRIRVPDWERAGIGDPSLDFFPLKYWTAVDAHSGWYAPHAALFTAFCDGYGAGEAAALLARPAARALEAQWLLRQLASASAEWRGGALREPYPDAGFYVDALMRLHGLG